MYLNTKCTVTVAARRPVGIVDLFFITILLIVTKACLLFATNDVTILGLLQGARKFCCRGGRFVTMSAVVCQVGRGTTKLTDVYVLSAVIVIVISAAIYVFINLSSRVGVLCPCRVGIRANCSRIGRGMSRRDSSVVRFVRSAKAGIASDRDCSCLGFTVALRGSSLAVKRGPAGTDLCFLAQSGFLQVSRALARTSIPGMRTKGVLVFQRGQFRSAGALHKSRVRVLKRAFAMRRGKCYGGHDGKKTVSFVSKICCVIISRVRALRGLRGLTVTRTGARGIDTCTCRGVLKVGVAKARARGVTYDKGIRGCSSKRGCNII